MCNRDHNRRSVPSWTAGVLLAACMSAAAAPGGGGEALVDGRREAPGWLMADSAPPLAVPKDTPGLSYVTYAGTRFQPTGSALAYSPLGGAIHADIIPAGGLSFTLDVDLPVGAVVREVIFYVIDNDAGADMSLSLRTYDPLADASLTLASASTSGASSSPQAIVVAVSPGAAINPTHTAYRLRVQPNVAGLAHLLRGARIGYLPSIVFTNGFEQLSIPMSTDGKRGPGIGSPAGDAKG